MKIAGQQDIRIQTIVKLDLIDCLKILFGRTLKITTKITIPQENEITNFNCSSTTDIVATSTFFTKQSKPNFGYVYKGENGNI